MQQIAFNDSFTDITLREYDTINLTIDKIKVALNKLRIDVLLPIMSNLSHDTRIDILNRLSNINNFNVLYTIHVSIDYFNR